MAEVDADTIQRLREKCKSSLYFFARAILGFSELDKDIHRPICSDLQNYQEMTRGMVVLPRTWFKSTIVSIAYPIWRAIQNPNIRILIAQNTITNAKKKISSIKTIFETNDLLRALFPEVLPNSRCQWSTEGVTLNRSLAEPEATFEPAGTGTTVISRHYDLIIQDDTVAPDFDSMTGEMQQPTRAEIEKAIGWHKQCHPLLLHPLRSQILIVGTRWAPEDLIGWILSHSPGYNVMTRSALERPGIIGIPASREQGGVPIWDRFDWPVLDELQRTMGLMFDMLYLNSPISCIGQIFKRDYIKYYDHMTDDSLMYCTSVDPAPSDARSKSLDSDYNAVITTAYNPSTGQIYVVHYNRERINPGELIDRIFDHYRAYKSAVVKVEAVAYQKTLSYWIAQKQKQLNEMFYVEEVKNARASKASRIMGLQPWFSAGRVYIRRDHTDLERELLSFDPAKKAGGHDDLIDALSMHIEFWTRCMDMYKKAKKEEASFDPFSGASVIDELMSRAVKEDQYPYDIGNMRMRLTGPLKRDYTLQN